MDEIQPLLGHVDEVHRTIASPTVDFNPKGDPENPLEWSRWYKLGVVALLGFMAFTTTFTCIGVVPIADRMVLDLNGEENKSQSILLVTVWELGEAAGPLLIAPLSEVFGRYPVFNVANMLFIFGTILSSISPTANIFIFARFLTGLAVASNVLNPAIIGDIYSSESRGSGMSLIMIAPLLGGAIGPAIGGAIAETFGWRNVLRMAALLAIVCELFFFFLLRETYKVRILQDRAARLREERKDESLKCAYEGATADWWSELRTSISRPVVVLLSSRVLQLIAFFGALIFSFYYILVTTLPGMLMEIYHFSPASTGGSFLTFSLGAAVGLIICNLYIDKIYIILGKRHHGIALPEYRIPFVILGSLFLPLNVALYGWAPSEQWPVSVLLFTVTAFGFLFMLIMVPMTSYVVDSFGIYSASAMTMVLISRNLGCTLLPMGIPPLTQALGLGWGFVLLGGCVLLLTPLPVVLMRYGASWRQKSVYTRVE